MAITLMPIMNVGGMQLFKISSNDSSEKILPKSKEIALRLIYIYSGLTALCGLSYWIFGMGKFDSLTHSMTTIATGGFSNYKTVFFTLGILQIILGISMFIPIIAQFIYSEIDSSFFGASIVTIIFGSLFFLSNLDHDKKLNLQQAFLLTALSWLSIAIFGSLPFIFSTIELSITDAFFESMSGITTTGSTIISDLENTPKGILLWRAILQWLGGIGIIVMAITLMPIMNVGGMQLFKISSNDSSEKILPKSKEIALRLIYIYSGLTALCALSYLSLIHISEPTRP